MKRSISLVLCLAMLISVFSCMGVAAAAANVSAKDLFTVKEGEFKDDKITYTIYLKKGVKMLGSVIYAKFDPAVLAVDESNTGPHMTTDSYGDECQSINGIYEQGIMENTDDQYSVGHVFEAGSTDYNAGSSNKPYMQFTFKAIDGNRPKTTVKFYCYEFHSQSNPSNNIPNGSDNFIFSDTRSTLGQVAVKSVESEKDGIRISWKKVTGADSYIVYKNSAILYETTDNTVTDYLDTKVKNNTKYTYSVRAVNEASYADANGKEYPAPLSEAVTTRFTLAPSEVTVSFDGDKAVVNWSAVKYAAYYRIYRRTVDKNGEVSKWESLKNKITTTTYSDTTAKSGTTYEYAVRAYSDGGYSALSVGNKLFYLAAPDFKVEATVKGVKISWSKVAGAESYTVHRKVSGGSWKKIKTTSSTSFTDTEATSGKKVYYRVKAVKGSTVSNYETNSLTYIKTPTVSVKNTTSGVYTSWKKVSGATSYEIYRKAGSAKSWTKIATTKKTSYTDKKVKSGTTYKYTVRAIGSSVKSKYGSTAYETIRFLSAPKLGKITSAKSGVTITWEKVKGASKYYIYRQTGSGDFDLIKTISSGSTVKYVDKSAKKGKTYTYKVYAGYSSYKSSYKSTLKIKDKY